DRRRPPDCDPGAHAPIAHPPYDLPATVSSSRTRDPESWRGQVSRIAAGVFRSRPTPYDPWMPACAGMTSLAVTNGVRGRPNPLKRLDSRKERAWIFLPLAWIFLPLGLDFPSLASR